ncbi:chorismate-binding protein [Demequina litorisediminis]|uniref:chorismate-binding protein n=1 Tax=Demequina litorisediminis TaxID=1849022 RepID=UPI0024E12812|nr:chorismate-binding protein [Demequina litorisediminis]
MSVWDAQEVAEAAFRGVRARGVLEHIDVKGEGHRLSEGGFWVVVGTFEGRIDAWRMEHAEFSAAASVTTGRPWQGPAPDAWTSSLDREAYMAAVARIRGDIRDGDVYQANLCRVLSAPLAAAPAGPDAVALSERLARGNPARFASRIAFPETADAPGAWVVSASPEPVSRDRRHASVERAHQGHGGAGEDMLPKDEAENVMITDLVRNDLSHVAVPGSVTVPEFLGLHTHPGLVHLQSTVEATLAPAFAWTPQAVAGSA